MQRRIIGAVALAALAAGTLAGLSFATTSGAHAASTRPNAAKYAATIQITAHGIPHITGANFADLGYGEGYALAGEDVCELMDAVIAARGDRSEYLGPDATYNTLEANVTNLGIDTIMRDFHQRKVVEKLLKDPVRGPGSRVKSMVTAEAAGIDKWLSTKTVTDPSCAGKPWIAPNVTATDIWYAIFMANMVGSSLYLAPAIAAAEPPTATSSGTSVAPSIVTARTLTAKQKATIRHALRINPDIVGSNATAVGKDVTSTGEGMLLGNPHFPWTGRYRFSQLQYTIPGKYDVAGAALIGSPVINIGWNNNMAWSHTVSTADRFTLYQYQTAGSPLTYKDSKGKLRHVITDTIHVPVTLHSGPTHMVTKHLYRTPEGFVLSAPTELMPWSTTSFWAIRDANAEHLRLLDTFLDMSYAKNVKQLIQEQDKGAGMPWTNTIAADRAGNVLYADHSVTPDVTDAEAARCETPVGRALFGLAGIYGLDGNKADGPCKWGTDKDSERAGVLGAKEMPEEIRTDWVTNSNDSYWLPNTAQPLTGYARIIGCEVCARSLRTQSVQHYVMDDIAAGIKETPEIFAGHEFANVSLAAERAKAGGNLDTLCAATGEADACKILHDWDGTYQADSIGPIVFQDFINDASAARADIWQNDWSASDPDNTPNTLKTDAPTAALLKQAIDQARTAGQLDAAWGTTNYRELADGTHIPLGGGPASAGLANVTNYLPVTNGSSHIQAIAFMPGGGLEARTMLTYSQSSDPTSPYYSDQTQLYSKNTWVDFAWTAAEIKAQLVQTIHLKGK